MKDSIKKAYRRIKRQCNGNVGKAVPMALGAIDQYVVSADIDDAFYKKYFETKRAILVHSTISASSLSGVVLGVTMSLAVNALTEQNLIGYFGFGVMGILLTYIAAIVLLTGVPYSVLYPHMVKKMDEKLESVKETPIAQ